MVQLGQCCIDFFVKPSCDSNPVRHCCSFSSRKLAWLQGVPGRKKCLLVIRNAFENTQLILVIILTSFVQLSLAEFSVEYCQRSMKTAIKMFPGFGWIYSGRSKFEKIRVFKVDHFTLPLFFFPKLRSVAQNEWKNPHIYFFYFWFKNK